MHVVALESILSWCWFSFSLEEIKLAPLISSQISFVLLEGDTKELHGGKPSSPLFLKSSTP